MRRCGICRNIGHNRQTCPRLGGNTIATGTEHNRSASGKRSASCSFCRGYEFKIDRTHTRSTCPIRKTARENWIEDNSSWAYKFKEDMKQAGMGIGALVQYGNEDDIFVVTAIDFENISKESSFGYLAEKLSVDERNYFRSTYIPAPSDSVWGSKVVSKISQSVVENQFPRDWGYGIYGVPRHLKDSKRKKNKKSDR